MATPRRKLGLQRHTRDTHQTDPADLMHRDSAQHDSRADVSPTASGNMLPESPCFQFSGSTPVIVGQDADPAHQRNRS
ncbi:hypothetical protein E4U32_008128 [Claviceps aff. humidiphila group G2b]|nr:hypothetical protein E4U32_008128 [Claviceps aff. humidiphila group G2b]